MESFRLSLSNSSRLPRPGHSYATHRSSPISQSNFTSTRSSLPAMTLRTFAVLAAASTTATLALPSELFDSSIATKLRATYQAQPPVPALWPQYTFPNGTWQYFGGNTWTTGFFPATMYAMAERAGLCPDLGLNASEWIAYGRGSSSGEIPGSTLSVQNQKALEHDVGFVSFPFQAELLVYVRVFQIYYVRHRADSIYYSIETLLMTLLKPPFNHLPRRLRAASVL